MGFLTTVSIDEIRARGSIKDSDVLKLRRALNDEQAIPLEAAEAILRLDEACPIKDPAWAAFFVDALSDYVLLQMKPEGYIVAEKARWLIDRLGNDGRIKGRVQLDLLVNVIGAARWSPPSLVVFALDQIRFAVQTGAGPLRITQSLEPGSIGSGDIELARQILLAFASDSSIPVTRAEADSLLAIDAAIAPGRSTPAWTEFLVKAVGNGILASFGLAVPSRGDVLRAQDHTIHALTYHSAADRSVEGSGHRFGMFAGSIISGGRVWSTCRPQSNEERALARLQRQRLEIVTNEAIEEPDEGWLLQHFGDDSLINDNHIALLAFLEHEAGALPQAVTALIARAKMAA